MPSPIAVSGITVHIFSSTNATLDAGGMSRIFFVDSGGSLVLRSITLTKGISTSAGGAIFVYWYCTLNMATCVVSNSRAITDNYGGGGVYISGHSSGNFDHCSFHSNTGDNLGGILVEVMSTSTFTACTFRSNSAVTRGGAGTFINTDALSTCDVSFESCTFVSNIALEGGGIALYGNLLFNFTACRFTSNSATGDDSSAGAVLATVHTEESVGPAVNFVGCEFSLNSASNICVAVAMGKVAELVVMACTFSENVAGSAGGAMYLSNTNDAIHIRHSLFVSNTANYIGGGGLIVAEGNVEVTGPCFISNTAGGSLATADGDGGGVLTLGSAALDVKGCTFESNTAFDRGGALNFQGTCERCWFAHNMAGLEGGAVCASRAVFLQNSVIAECTAEESGAAAYSAAGLAVTNSRVYGFAWSSERAQELFYYDSDRFILQLDNVEFSNNALTAIHFDASQTVIVRNCAGLNESDANGFAAMTCGNADISQACPQEYCIDADSLGIEVRLEITLHNQYYVTARVLVQCYCYPGGVATDPNEALSCDSSARISIPVTTFNLIIDKPQTQSAL